MPWLLTGGAGYIGSHVLQAVRAGGLDAVVLDDLSSGDPRRVPETVPLVVGSVLDGTGLRAVLRQYEIDGVIHLAAKKSVEESVCHPLYYYRENLSGLLTLLEAMAETGVRRLVYSSSAAVYGTPETEQVDEASPTRPESAYGRTKLTGEWMVRDAAAAHGLSCVSLRYFNVVGCAEPGLGDVAGANLFPRVMNTLTRGRRPVVFGTDYPTRDGSCLRDYVHVQDLAEAHLAAARLTLAERRDEIVNIGCGRGYTVLEVLSAIQRVTGQDTTPEVLARRPGDPAGMVAAVDKAARVLTWRARLDLDAMVSSAWAAVQSRAELAVSAS